MDIENKLKHAQNSLFALAILKFGKMMKRKVKTDEVQTGHASNKSNQFFQNLMSKYQNVNDSRRLSAPYENAIAKLVLNGQNSDPSKVGGAKLKQQKTTDFKNSPALQDAQSMVDIDKLLMSQNESMISIKKRPSEHSDHDSQKSPKRQQYHFMDSSYLDLVRKHCEKKNEKSPEA
jgi:hypothetical protein